MKNYKYLPMNRDISKLTEYYDPDSKLNYKVLERKEISDGSLVLLEINSGEMIIGYDVCLCRNNKLPKTEEWGEWAWNFNSKEKASEQFNNLFHAQEQGR